MQRQGHTTRAKNSSCNKHAIETTTRVIKKPNEEQKMDPRYSEIKKVYNKQPCEEKTQKWVDPNLINKILVPATI